MPNLGQLALAIALILALYSIAANIYGARRNATEVIVSARQELVMPPATTLDEAHKFGMFMLKAVLDGRAGQLIDLAKVNLTR